MRVRKESALSFYANTKFGSAATTRQEPSREVPKACRSRMRRQTALPARLSDGRSDEYSHKKKGLIVYAPAKKRLSEKRRMRGGVFVQR